MRQFLHPEARSPRRGSHKFITIVTQGSQTRLGLNYNRCFAARRVITSKIHHDRNPRLADSRWA
jgi:hypothetical protein